MHAGYCRIDTQDINNTHNTEHRLSSQKMWNPGRLESSNNFIKTYGKILIGEINLFFLVRDARNCLASYEGPTTGIASV